MVDGVPSFIFVQAKYTVEVGGWVGGWLGGWLGGWAGGGGGGGGGGGLFCFLSRQWAAPSSQSAILTSSACPTPALPALPCCPCPYPSPPLHWQSSEAERIGVDQVTKILPTGAASGTNQRE